MDKPHVPKLPELPSKGVPVKRWAHDTTVALRSIVGGVTPPVTRQDSPLAVRVRPYKVVTEFGDYITAKPVGADGNSFGEAVALAKPYLIRRTPFDGLSRNTVTFTYSDVNTRVADATETQVIVPSYVAGDVVYGAPVTPNAGVVDADGVSIRLLDLNLDGRAWAQQA